MEFATEIAIGVLQEREKMSDIPFQIGISDSLGSYICGCARIYLIAVCGEVKADSCSFSWS